MDQCCSKGVPIPSARKRFYGLPQNSAAAQAEETLMMITTISCEPRPASYVGQFIPATIRRMTDELFLFYDGHVFSNSCAGSIWLCTGTPHSMLQMDTLGKRFGEGSNKVQVVRDGFGDKKILRSRQVPGSRKNTYIDTNHFFANLDLRHMWDNSSLRQWG